MASGRGFTISSSSRTANPDQLARADQHSTHFIREDCVLGLIDLICSSVNDCGDSQSPVIFSLHASPLIRRNGFQKLM